jgi:hypothetical protein
MGILPVKSGLKYLFTCYRKTTSKKRKTEGILDVIFIMYEKCVQKKKHSKTSH